MRCGLARMRNSVNRHAVSNSQNFSSTPSRTTVPTFLCAQGLLKKLRLPLLNMCEVFPKLHLLSSFKIPTRPPNPKDDKRSLQFVQRKAPSTNCTRHDLDRPTVSACAHLTGWWISHDKPSPRSLPHVRSHRLTVRGFEQRSPDTPRELGSMSRAPVITLPPQLWLQPCENALQRRSCRPNGPYTSNTTERLCMRMSFRA